MPDGPAGWGGTGAGPCNLIPGKGVHGQGGEAGTRPRPQSDVVGSDFAPCGAMLGSAVVRSVLCRLSLARDVLFSEEAERGLAMAGTDAGVLAGRSVTAGSSNGREREVDSVAWIVVALEAALKARAPGLYESTPLVARLAARLGRELQLDAQARSLLDASVRVRDIGMLGLADAVVLNTRPLTPADWELVNRHPALGAEILEGLAPMAQAAQIVRSHHERWDGEGYPDGLVGDGIPLLSRVIAICDAFVAMASDRPYRRGIGTDGALEHVRRERGSQFDPRITDIFIAMIGGIGEPPDVDDDPDDDKTISTARGRGPRVEPGRELASAIAEFDVVPVFAPAYDQLVAAIASSGSVTGGAIVSAIESDTGLTVAVLRKAQAGAGRLRIANIGDAVGELSPEQIQDAISELPRVEFPWRTTPLQLQMHRSRIHAQAVARAADRLAREVLPRPSDDLVAAALLHDVGKLVLSRVVALYPDTMDTTSATPEARAREERRALGLDHASVGALLLRRWGLPRSLAAAVENHHTSDAADEVATFVRLADMLAHHAQGDAVDRTVMVRVAHACELSTKALRDVMFDLPHTGGSRRHRAQRSPLSIRETEILGLLAEGKVYKLIAFELDLAVSTVRTNLHTTYKKLGVVDRAQAVLRATEMGWI
jgi:putative nucleotidyltransferase with HDIG domain